MDGVLCDFYSAVQKLTDKPIKSLSVSSMWAITRAQPDFWESLQWVAGGQSVWEVVDRYGGHILSALPYSDPNSEPGKREWLRSHLGLTDRNRIHLVCPRNVKKDYAMSDGTPNILIDDYEKNTSEWRSAGGIAIAHVSAQQTLNKLDHLGFVARNVSGKS